MNSKDINSTEGFRAALSPGPEQDPISMTADSIHYSDLPEDDREIFLDRYVSERVESHLFFDGYGFISHFFEEVGLAKEADILLVEHIRLLRKAVDESKDIAAYAYFTPEGKFVGFFDDNIYEPEVGLLFSSLSQSAQSRLLLNDLGCVDQLYGLDKEFYLGLVAQLGALEEFDAYMRAESTAILLDEDSELGAT